MTPLQEILEFKFDDERLQPRFNTEASHAYKILEEIAKFMAKPLTADLGVLKVGLVKYIQYAGMLGTIQNNMNSWQAIALNQQEKYFRAEGKNDFSEKQIHEMAIDSCRGIIELANLPEIFRSTIKDNKAMIKTIMGQEMTGGYGG